MADFFQNGIITTLQNVTKRPIEDIEAEISQFIDKRKIALLLPALYSEFERPAMYTIIEELKKAHFIDTVVLSLDQANEEQFLHVKKIMSELPQNVKIVWNHGKKIQALYSKLIQQGFPLNIPGKGRVVWMALGYILADNRFYAIALHDCDIVNYKRDIVARLVFPIIHRGLNYEFSKGYYARVSDKIYGRVMRLFYTPLVRALKKLIGYDNKFLDYLDSFRYALSGEFAIIRELAKGIRFSPDWGLEVSLLSEIYQNTSINRICQVEVLETYEHKHSPLNKNEPNKGLLRMATDIAKTLFRILSQEGILLSDAFFKSLVSTYFQQARIAIESFNAFALINGVAFDRHSEIAAVEAFTQAINNAKTDFLENPIGIRLISPWVRVDSALPEFADELLEAVEEDNK
ncbi:glycosyl transferase [Deferribacter autotrophicus]|uniref:Glycosyl transferase n=1 Tax=Deferribacter autotrophicus TaxID=500465 RepID=A0A5A8F4S2_9BACT|nr:glycosyl transferase [Deferribacter autotrophicus]KAA0258977.1 glycosyl transferase [Deferribacter autotrophicus]